jgi:asparagine synthase (glutamine-hydrolysing)
MCGFAGIARAEPRGVSRDQLARMIATLRHRGPDGSGLWTDERVGLAHTRLSIIDVVGGAQPLGNEDGAVVIAYNGEVYNYVELRAELEARGHRFTTRSDTEVLVHAWEEWGPGMLERLNGQFAFALRDRRRGSVVLARDRLGVRPLCYAAVGGDLLFASEAKALFASGEVRAAPDLAGLDQVFTFWAAREPRTVFAGVRALAPGTWAEWRPDGFTVRRWYALDFPRAAADAAARARELGPLLESAVRLRLRADVPVGGYLSGGLDSSSICALAARATPDGLTTFSVAFADPLHDESAQQRTVADALGTKHAVRPIDATDIAAVFPDVVRHAETPLVRTAPAPMYLLARLVREHGIKVVLTGEGADEAFLGYDLFKETLVRLFCLRRPESTARPRLFDRLYPYQAAAGRGGELWRRFFLDAGPASDPLFSHLPRVALTARIKDFLHADVRAALAGTDALAELRDELPPGFGAWTPLGRAAWLEFHTLLAPYLLASQGDRMSLAHAVEGRYPFLDHRVVELAVALPEGEKVIGLKDKVALRRWAASLLPPAIRSRPKQPYRAPDIPAFFEPEPEWVRALLDPEHVRRHGLFDLRAVAGLVRRCREGRARGVGESQALVGVLSTLLWHDTFITAAPAAAAPAAPIAATPSIP